jgi:ribonuclease P protein component
VENKPYPLKRSSDFREVATHGTRKRLSAWLTVQILPSTDSNNYFGITVSRKVANSVVRNKLKRWVRNCVRTEKWPAKYKACIIVFVFRPQADSEFFSKKQYSEFKQLFADI